MDKTLYDLMNWADVEEIVFSESDDPHRILGPHRTEKGLLVQCFLPGSQKVTLRNAKKGGVRITAEMEEADEAGFYACLIPVPASEEIPAYVFDVQRADGTKEVLGDPYAYPLPFTDEAEDEDLLRFAAGTAVDLYERLGARSVVREGAAGVLFSVWAPNAMRVSVVGDFNHWDGRCHQMRRIGAAGVFELFIPGLKPGMLYKFEIKSRDRKIFLKADPFARASELRPGTASVIAGPDDFLWSDNAWLLKRRTYAGQWDRRPLRVLEVAPGSFGQMNWRDMAAELAETAGSGGFTHVELLPVTEHPLDESLGYQSTGFFSPSARWGTPEDFRFLVNRLHEAGIGVILDWPFSGFPRDASGPAAFDGTLLYEGEGTGEKAVFRFDRPEVRSFLRSAAFFWAEQYHVDGLRAVNIAAALYYGSAGEQRQNMFGGGENLEGAAFLRELCSELRDMVPGFLLIADSSASWPRTTGTEEENRLGFTLQRSAGWARVTAAFFGAEPAEKRSRYGDFTGMSLFQYSESFQLPLSRDLSLWKGGGPLSSVLYGETEAERQGALRALLAFQTAWPGKKLLYQEVYDEADGRFLKDLGALYLASPALWKLDREPEGFSWINSHSWEESVIAFLRRTEDPAETLLVVLNCSGTAYPAFDVGVPFRGTFREVFNTDRKEYGGTGSINPRALRSRRLEVDEQTYGITLVLPAYAALVFSCRPMISEQAADGKTEGQKKTGHNGTEAGGEGRTGGGRGAGGILQRDAVRAASAAKQQAMETAGKARKQAAETAGKAKRQAVKTAGKAKKQAVETAGRAKKQAMEMAGKARKQALETIHKELPRN